MPSSSVSVSLGAPTGWLWLAQVIIIVMIIVYCYCYYSGHAACLLLDSVRLQVHQEQQDPVQETGRRQVHLCALTIEYSEKQGQHSANNGLKLANKGLTLA